MLRLADFESKGSPEALLTEADRLLSEVEAVEAQCPEFEMGWGKVLRENFHRLGDVSSWLEIMGQQIRPSLAQLGRTQGGAPRLSAYREKLGQALQGVTAYFETVAAEESQRIRERLDELCPELRTTPSLSGKAVRIIRSLSGVGTVLVGMRRKEYVGDILRSCADAPISPEKALEVLRALRQ